jgi:guanyl-specific ribonuclease Sa
MKKYLRILLAILCMLLLTACGSAAGDVADALLNESSWEEEAEEDFEAEEDITEEEAEAVSEAEEETTEEAVLETETSDAEEAVTLPEDGTYTSKEDVALYIHLYGHLPDNFITKKEAEKLGWSGGSLEPYAPGKCIGGSRFGNYEGQLPDKSGRTYTECDIDTLGAEKRGAKRIVYSNDGLIYYTEDHYETFELLYGEEE